MGIFGKRASALRLFLQSEAAGGALLICAAVAALILANSPLTSSYFGLLHAKIGPAISPALGVMPAEQMSIEQWINDGLMAIFFLFVGLEIKREFTDGELSSWPARRLPVIAAAAGMMVPAIVYITMTGGDPALIRGWAIPAATDIAFAMCVLAMLGRNVPASLKLLLLSIAIADDLGAVVIIALFYTLKINAMMLAIAGLIWGVMLALGRLKVMALWPYFLLFAMLWYAMLQSGVHAALAGVLAAFAIPFTRTLAAPDAADSVLHRMEHMLAAPAGYIIVPLFGFANAGVALGNAGLGSNMSVFHTLPLAVALGLFAGKQIGIFGSIFCAVKCGIAAKPAGASWTQVYGMAVICGIGFTMSFFIGGLAFTDEAHSSQMKIGVMAGSVLSAIWGSAILLCASRRKNLLK